MAPQGYDMILHFMRLHAMGRVGSHPGLFRRLYGRVYLPPESKRTSGRSVERCKWRTQIVVVLNQFKNNFLLSHWDER